MVQIKPKMFNRLGTHIRFNKWDRGLRKKKLTTSEVKCNTIDQVFKACQQLSKAVHPQYLSTTHNLLFPVSVALPGYYT